MPGYLCTMRNKACRGRCVNVVTGSHIIPYCRKHLLDLLAYGLLRPVVVTDRSFTDVYSYGKWVSTLS